MSRVTGKVAQVAEVAQGERALPEGVVCRIRLYGGTDFVFRGKAAKYTLRVAI